MEALSDPCNDRPVKDLAPPPHRPLSPALLYPDPAQPDLPDLALVRQFLLKEGSFAKEQVIKLLADVTKLFSKRLYLREGTQCRASRRTRHHCGRYSRIVLRPHSYVREGGRCSLLLQDALPGRLCRQRHLLN